MTEMKPLPPIRFYIPNSECWSGDLPTTVEGYWPWISSQAQIDSWGPFSWTLQTYLYLKADGFPCDVTHTLPDEGIVLAHRDFLPTDLEPGPKLLVACILADREEPGFIGRHPYAQFHIVQNPRDPMVIKPSTLWRAHFMPYWPQPGLIPRDPARADRFEVAAYFGYEHNLAPELRTPSWHASLQELGLTWRIIPREWWHDYSNVDVVVPVRSFGNTQQYVYKPPSKLHNAWCAGVPAILGCESAYRARRQTALDYLEVRSPDEAISALRHLSDHADLRRAMGENGRTRASEIQPEKLVRLWRRLLCNEILIAYEQWCSASPRTRDAFINMRTLAVSSALEKRDPGDGSSGAYQHRPGQISNEDGIRTVTVRSAAEPSSNASAGLSGHQRQRNSVGSALILVYHRVADVELDPWSLCVTPEHFAQHLEILKRHTFTMSLPQLLRSLDEGRLPPRTVVVTFDDGYANNLQQAKPLLERHDIPATVFLATGHIGHDREFWWDELERLLLQPGALPETLSLTVDGSPRRWELGEAAHWSADEYLRHRGWKYEEPPPSRRHELYREIYQLLQPLPASEQQKVLEALRAWANVEPHARPTHRALSAQEALALAQGGLVEIGSHTVTHPVLSALTIAAQQDELERSKSDLEKLLNRPATSFAYPYGGSHVYTAETEHALREAGFRCACTTTEGAVHQGTDRFHLPRVMVHDWDGEEFARQLRLWFDYPDLLSRLETHERKFRELTAWTGELEHAKAWLEEQRGDWQRIAEERERVIQDQQAWIAELERGKAWLTEQQGNWQRIAEERERIIQDQQAWIAKLERAMALLEEQ